MTQSSRLRGVMFGVLLCAAVPLAAEAHPHVWVTSKSELVFAPDGTVAAVRHAWTFDEMFSAYASQGLDTNNDGKLSREELAELAETNVTSLKDFAYFSVGQIGGETIEFGDAADYWLEADSDNVLTLHFTLPLKSKPAKGEFSLSVYDPTWFVDFTFAEREPVKLVQAPAGCVSEVRRPEPVVSSAPLSESFFEALTASSEFGSQFASQIVVRCK